MLTPALRHPRRWWPRWTLRLRLTLLYGAVFLVAGAVLLVITYELVSNSPPVASPTRFVVARSVAGTPPPGLPPSAGFLAAGTVSNKVGAGAVQAYAGQVSQSFRRLNEAQGKQLKTLATKAQVALRDQQSAQRGALLTRSGIALGIMAILSIGLGWLMAGRALRPVRTMSARARGISERNLHERLALDGPDDELKELGDTFDELLGRLESAFESQRQFVANASHELRTPITLERALVEVALSDPGATTDSLRGTCERVLAASERQERLIEALLTLARSQRGLESRQEIDLGAVAGEALLSVQPSGTRVESDLGSAIGMGDPALVERLIANLIDNALRYNLPHDGWVSVWTGVRSGLPTIRVRNSGPPVSSDEALTLTEPFRRLGGTRTDARGSGLGLSIVGAIARAHGAALTTTPRPEGGLDVEVSFPALAVRDESGVPLTVDVARHG
jgi:signal transduction histidine kinase